MANKSLASLPDFSGLAVQLRGMLNAPGYSEAGREAIERLIAELKSAASLLPMQEGGGNSDIPDYTHCIEHAPIGLIQLDQARRVEMANLLAQELLVFASRNSRNWTFTAFMTSGIQHFLVWSDQGCEGPIEVELYTHQGSRAIRLDGVVFEQGGEKKYLLSLIEIEAYQHERRWLRRFQHMFEKMASPTLLLSADGEIVDVNAAFRVMVAMTRERLIGRNINTLVESLEGLPLQPVRQLMKIDEHWSGRVHLLTSRGAVLQEELTIIMIDRRDGRQVYAASFVDLTQTIATHHRLQSMADTDELTGLINRACFNKQFERMMTEAQRKGEQLTLFFIDLDKFKALNDTHGHQYGDILLRQFARRIAANVREGDVVARLGGDEFAVLMEADISLEVLRVIAKKMVEQLQHPYHLDDLIYSSSASIGVARYPDDAIDGESLYHCADAAMYMAKRVGRNSYQFFEAELQEELEAQQRLEDLVEHVIKENKIELYYQPQNDLESGEVIGFEALARMRDDSGAFLPPDIFISEAERSGMIVPLGIQILKRAFQHVGAWQLRGFDLPVSVNLSVLQFNDPLTMESIGRLVMEHPDVLPLIRLEITETYFFERSDAVKQAVAELIDMGFAIVLDDFGTGYSSVYSLNKIPFEMVKVDRSFVAALDSGSEEDEMILKALLSLVNMLGIKLLAEGVEHEKQIEFLLAHGCTLGQGFYYHRPMPGGDVMMYLNRKRLSPSAE